MLMFSVRVWLREIGLHTSESEQACCLVQLQLQVLGKCSLLFSQVWIFMPIIPAYALEYLNYASITSIPRNVNYGWFVLRGSQIDSTLAHLLHN